jgi:DNA adenine methylase
MPKKKPVINWVGNKTKLFPEIAKQLPKTYGKYYEPFCGSGSVLFNLLPENGAIVGDTCPYITHLFQVLQKNPRALFRKIGSFSSISTKDRYLQVRDEFNAGLFKRITLVQLVRFLYLLKNCYGHIWMLNKAETKFINVFNKTHQDKEIPLIDKERALEVSAYLQTNDVGFVNASYTETLKDAKKGDLVYMDPPYLYEDESKKGYNGRFYGKDFDHAELAKTFRDLDKKGVLLLMSNSDSKTIRSLYKGFKIVKIQNKTSGNRGKTVHDVLIKNF